LRNIAKIISVLLHPLLIPTIICVVLICYAPSALPITSIKGQIEFTLFIFVITFLLPLFAIFIYFFWNKGFKNMENESEGLFVKSIIMESRKERIIPFTITTAIYASITYFLIYKAPYSLRILPIVFGSITMCLAIVTFVTRFWKISAHSAGVAGGLGFLIGIYFKQEELTLFYPVLTFLILVGILMSSRLYLNCHTPLQVIAGATIGFCICLGSMLFFG